MSRVPSSELCRVESAEYRGALPLSICWMEAGGAGWAPVVIWTLNGSEKLLHVPEIEHRLRHRLITVPTEPPKLSALKHLKRISLYLFISLWRYIGGTARYVMRNIHSCFCLAFWKCEWNFASPWSVFWSRMTHQENSSWDIGKDSGRSKLHAWRN